MNLTQEGNRGTIGMFTDPSIESVQRLETQSSQGTSQQVSFTSHHTGFAKRSQTHLKVRPAATIDNHRNNPLDDYGAGGAMLLITTNERSHSPYSVRQVVVDPVKQYNKKKVSLPPLHGISETNLKLLAVKNLSSGDPTLYHSITEAKLSDRPLNSNYRLSTLFKSARSPKRYSEDVTLDPMHPHPTREHDTMFYQPPESAASRIKPTDSIYTRKKRALKPNLLPPMSKVMEVKDMRVTNTMKGDRVSQGAVQHLLESYREYYPRATIAGIQPSVFSQYEYEPTPGSLTRSSSVSNESNSPPNKFISTNQAILNSKRDKIECQEGIVFNQIPEESTDENRSTYHKASIDVIQSSLKKRSVSRFEPEPMIWNYSLEPRQVKVFNIPNERVVLYVYYKIPKDAPRIELLIEVSKTHNGKFFILVFQRFRQKRGQNKTLFDDIQVKEMWQLQAIQLLKLFDNDLSDFIKKCVGFNARRNKVDFSKIGKLLAQQETLQKPQLKTSLKIFQNKVKNTGSWSRRRKNSKDQLSGDLEAVFWHQSFNPADVKKHEGSQFSISLSNMNERSPMPRFGKDRLSVHYEQNRSQMGDSTVAISLRQDDSKADLVDKDQFKHSKTPILNPSFLKGIQRDGSESKIQASKMFDSEEIKLDMKNETQPDESSTQPIVIDEQDKNPLQTGENTNQNSIQNHPAPSIKTNTDEFVTTYAHEIQKNQNSGGSLVKISAEPAERAGPNQEIAIHEDAPEEVGSQKLSQIQEQPDKASDKPSDIPSEKPQDKPSDKPSEEPPSNSSDNHKDNLPEQFVRKPTELQAKMPLDQHKRAATIDLLKQQNAIKHQPSKSTAVQQESVKFAEPVESSEKYTTIKTSVDLTEEERRKMVGQSESEKYTTIKSPSPSHSVETPEPDIKQRTDVYKFKIGLRNLKGADVLSQADSYVIVQLLAFSGELKQLHRTEVMNDNDNPDFKDAFEVPVLPGSKRLIFSVKDKDIWKDDLIGTCELDPWKECNLAKVEKEIKNEEKIVGTLVLTKAD